MKPRSLDNGLSLSVDCLFLRSPSRVPYRTELIPRAPNGDVPGPPTRNPCPRHRSCRGHIPPQSWYLVLGSHVRGLLVTYLRWTKTEPAEFSTRVSFRPEMFLLFSIGMPNFVSPNLDSVNHCTSKEISMEIKRYLLVQWLTESRFGKRQ